MSSTGASWSPPVVEGNPDLATHLSGLSVEEYAAQRQAATAVGPATGYPNVHTPQRPAFGPYDGAAAQYLYYAAGVDPASFTPGGAGTQAFSYADLTGTPMQSLASAAGVAFEPYPSPPESFGTHSQDARSGHQPQASGNNFQQQGTTAGSTRSNQIYRPPQLQQQQQQQQQFQQQVAQGQAQHGYFSYGDRSPFWAPQPTVRDGGGRHRAMNSSLSSTSGRRSNGQHYTGLTDFAQAAAFGLHSPLSPAYPGSPTPAPFTLNAPAYPYSPTPSHYAYVTRQPKRPAEDTAVRSQRLEEFRQRKPNRFEWPEIYGSICEFAGDQHGSRFIQNKLENATPEERAKVFEEIMPNAYQLMTDVFGNYVIQKLFEHGDQTQKAALAKKMEGHVLQLSMQMYGCRVMQKALEHVLVDQREKLIAELNGHIIDCVKSSNANHVIQRLISLDPPASVTDAFIGHVQELSTHPFGCRVLQKSFEVLNPANIRPLLNEMHSCSSKLMMDQFGNYVVQSVITDAEGREHDRDKVVNEIKPRIYELSRHKFASNVVEKALKFSKATDRRQLIAELIGSDEGAESRIGILLRDSYGNFPVQTALAEADPDQRDKLLAIIVPLMPNLRHTPCGRRLEAKITDYESKGLLPSLTHSVSASTLGSPDLVTNASDNGSAADGLSVVTSNASPNGKSTALRRVASSPETQDESQVLKALLA